MEVLGWLLVLAVVACVAVAPAFPFVRRRLGLAEDSQEARAVRRFLRSPLRAMIGRREGRTRPGGFERMHGGDAGTMDPTPQLAYPQQLAMVDTQEATAPTKLDQLWEMKAAFARAGDLWGEANALNQVGFTQERRSQFDEAAEMHLQALELFRKTGDLAGVSDSLSNLGVVCARLGKTEEAMANHREALRAREDLGDPQRISNSDNNIGVLLARDQPERAKSHLAEATGLASAVSDNRGLGKIVNNNTVLCLEPSEDDALFDHVCRQFERSLALRYEGEDLRGKAKTQNNLGVVHSLWGKFGLAERHFREAATLAGSVEDHVGLFHMLENWLLLLDAYEHRQELPERIAGRIASLKTKGEVPGRDVLEADRETYPIEFSPDYPKRGQVALLSSGSTTPATMAQLRNRLGEGDPAK